MYAAWLDTHCLPVVGIVVHLALLDRHGLEHIFDAVVAQQTRFLAREEEEAAENV